MKETRQKDSVNPVLLVLAIVASQQGVAEGNVHFELEEIIVTAEKRSADVQDTAIAITAMEGARLTESGIHNVQALSSFVPNLHVGTRGDDVELAIRGVSSSNNTEVGDPAVAFHVDGIYTARPAGAGAVFYDVERVEVLRGPQGTLYGRNATTGSVNVISNKPSDEFELELSADIGNYNSLVTSGMINLPVADTVAVRGAFFTSDHNGYRDNGSVDDGDDADSQAGRIHLAWDINPDADLLLTTDYYSSKGVGGVVKNQPVAGDAEAWALNFEGRRDNNFTGHRLEFNYDLDFATLTYLAGWRKQEIDRIEDFDGSSILSATKLMQREGVEKTHELRLTSDSEGPLLWQLGAYYFEEDQEVFAQFNAGLDFGLVISFIRPSVSAESKALFGQVSYDIRDDLRLTAGLRHSTDKKGRKGYETIELVGLGTFPADDTNGDTWSANNWKLGLDWFWAEDNLLYVTAGTGYKAGGYSDHVTYDEENILSYELGSKNRFWDNRVQFNAALFYYDYDDLQVSQAEGTSLETRNAGKSTVYGAEFELTTLLTEHSRLDLSLAYLHSEYKDFITIDEHPGGSFDVVDLSGNRLTKAPEWSVNVSYEYEWELTSGASLKGRIQSHFETESYLRPFNRASEQQDAYTKTDLMLIYSTPEKHWEFEAYVRNLENESVLIAVEAIDAFGLLLQAFGAPRTYGARVSYRW
mgnify:CR=1 FL=1